MPNTPDDRNTTLTLELPAQLAADLEILRKEFGEELIA